MNLLTFNNTFKITNRDSGYNNNMNNIDELC